MICRHPGRRLPPERLELGEGSEAGARGLFSFLYPRRGIDFVKDEACENELHDQFLTMKIIGFLGLLAVAGSAWAEEPPQLPPYSAALEEQAKGGDADAQYQLGDCYFFGLGVKRDMVEGASWYRKAAEAGQMKAQFNLGGCFHEGMGVEPDLMAAIRWWRKSAGQDYAPAEISIGDCYIFGKGVGRDEEEGVRWFRKAAAQNYAAAQHRLGNCYYHGKGVRKDLAQAIQWYRQASEQGYKPSQRALRELGDRGD